MEPKFETFGNKKAAKAIKDSVNHVCNHQSSIVEEQFKLGDILSGVDLLLVEGMKADWSSKQLFIMQP